MLISGVVSAQFAADFHHCNVCSQRSPILKTYLLEAHREASTNPSRMCGAEGKLIAFRKTFEDGLRIRTVEHLLSALEAAGVDNCRIQIENLDDCADDVEIPIFDGSAREWVAALEEVGLEIATDVDGKSCEKIAPHVNEPVHVWKNDSFVAAFPSEVVQVTYGINFPQAPAIGLKWFPTTPLDDLVYSTQIAPSRTFCIYEEVEQMRNAGLIKGGSLENAIVCSTSKGWLNPPLRFSDEPCRHKILDLIGDLSLFAQFGNQGLPVAHFVAYKGGHALHVDLARRLMGMT
ncbi:probable UDP-3-O-acyl-N-acetylglucosamine deacetylase 1, mitochondrial isoform X2 [Cicer arietinum]|uniref:UDP-3-O-acyl-N-acetylglucosamine deacetylase n=1 Tax=Cicer arietinum TaxID=3827 RepID=A0A3Q7YEA3_CICAR|nr:probable UDP-3-O-acyl-N-acetylglucosamine deacetylase 2, mitochondrial isoform X2 [Cicer arietinum]